MAKQTIRMKTKRLYESPHVTVVVLQAKYKFLIPLSPGGTTNECFIREHSIWEDDWEQEDNYKFSTSRSIWER